jgi:early secretory antigenic target protein ESAT-6
VSEISVAYGGVNDLAQQVRTSANEIKSELDDLHSRVNKVAAAWTGEAQIAYTALQKDWSAKTDDLHCVLFEIAKRMEEATQDYQNTDRKIANAFRGA